MIGAVRRAPAWTITALIGLILLIVDKPSPDLATASYRSHLFSSEGLTLWDNAWYGGHHMLAYSVLSPALSAILGAQLLAVISMTVATALFTAVIDGHFPRRATRIAALWFAVGAGLQLLSWRIAFDLGLPLGLAAVLAAQRDRRWLALALAVLCSLASPVAGAFLALAMIAWALAGPDRRWPAVLAVAALAPIGLLVIAFPEGGTQPYVASSFFPALAGVLLVGALVPPEQRALRIGVLLYAAAMVASYLVPTAVGGNADRLGALFAGPIAACVLAGGSASGRRSEPAAAPFTLARRRRLLIVLAPLLFYWQVNAPAADFAAAVSEPAVSASYYAPLLAELRALGVGYSAHPARIEVVPSVDHWEARWVAPEVMIARGWERQLDAYRNGLFYGSAPLTAADYRAWLNAQAIAYVALPDYHPDYSGTAEANLLRNGRHPYLREVWRSRHWRLFAVLGAPGLADAPAALEHAGHDSFTLRAPSAGTFTVRLHFSPYWAIARGSGCVGEAPGEWTSVLARRAEVLHVVIRFSLARVFDRGVRCT